ncbi:hypothetical protein DEJ48_18465 [Streptomyces venezuelae]|uniref:Uncharacterized protein n=1 Tax=Streptomyces venezuelae TaxID=54571 RepID=A0A5P2BYT5_STRVZ|nr:hypothetical protein DEJ48_18465 [Streptomyces venezuelae]
MSPVATPAEERQAQHVYASLLAHYEDCGSCRVENYCEAGGRLRRAHRATRVALGRAERTEAASSPGEGS